MKRYAVLPSAAESYMSHFLLIYDARKGELREDPMQFRPGPESLRAYEAAEQQFMADPSVQVLLLGADSLETIKVTHGNFFRRFSVEEMIDDLVLSKVAAA